MTLVLSVESTSFRVKNGFEIVIWELVTLVLYVVPRSVCVVFVVQVQDCLVPFTYTLIVPVRPVTQLVAWNTMVSFVLAPVTDPVNVSEGEPNELVHVRFVSDIRFLL